MPNEEVAVLESLKKAPLTVRPVFTKVVFVVHLVLTSWGTQGYWSPDSYVFYNLLFFITLFYSIHSKESAEIPLLCFIISTVSVFLDVVVLCIYFPDRSYGSADRFSVGMAILNLIFRPVSCLALFHEWAARQHRADPVEVPGQGGYAGGFAPNYQ